MNPEPPAIPEEDAGERQAFSILNDYLDQLHAGKAPDRARLLQEHPDLAAALECLEALDSLAVAASGLTDDPAKIVTADQADREQSEALPPSAWKEFGKYELLEEIGRGGMGVVFKARQKDLDRLVAIKMIRASLIASAEDVARFQAEARAAASLSHPNIVAVHEISQVHGQHFFAMQYVAGPSLAELLQKGPLPINQAARLIAAVARAVAHLHANGIIHRDLKPSNILLHLENSRTQYDKTGPCLEKSTICDLQSAIPKITDFGLVKLVEGGARLTSTDAIVGTPSYMSPEQAGGRSDQVGPLSDVYGLGAVLYVLLTGRPPFAESTALDTLAQVLEREPPEPRKLNPHIPLPLEAICLKCLEKSPRERYASADALADDLERFLRGEDVEARSAGLAQRFRRWLRREPALVLRLVALAHSAVIAQVRYMLAPEASLALHERVLGVLGSWAVVSVFLQCWLRKNPGSILARLVWAGCDVFLLTALLQIMEALDSPLMVGYPLLVAASGLWFRVGLIWFTTAGCLLGYGWLVVITAYQGQPPGLLHYHEIFAIALVLEGLMVAYQVQRVRTLSRYYEHRPLP